MQIILVHPKLKRARSITITRRSLAGAALLALLVLASTSGLLSYVTVRHALEAQLPLVRGWLPQAEPAEAPVSHDDSVRRHIDALATRLGQLQAQLTRLDALGERIASKTGIVRPADVPLASTAPAQRLRGAAGLAPAGAPNGRSVAPAADGLGTPLGAPGRGGPLPSTATPPTLLLEELNRAVDRAAMQFERQSDTLSLLESELLYRDVSKRLVPNAQPIEDGTLGSRFGVRSDPFNNRQVLHEGLDFPAPVGAPILAAGAGVVVFARWHSAYGNQVDIDHGNGLVTRYAHASELLVREGDIVRQGQRIAKVGSTGRSTGPHLHFEVRVDGMARDPLRYLKAELAPPGAGRPALARR